MQISTGKSADKSTENHGMAFFVLFILICNDDVEMIAVNVCMKGVDFYTFACIPESFQ